MAKPQQILELEKIIGEEIEETSTYEMSHEGKNYALNIKRQIVGLSLHHCNLKDISFLSNYRDLKILFLGFNKITDIKPLRDLTNLIKLDLRANQITDIISLNLLTKLTEIFLDGNYIADITPLKKLPHLNLIDLRANELDILPAWILDFNLEIKYESGFFVKDGIYLGSNPLNSPPLEVIEQGNAAIKAYFDAGRKRPLNELKVLFVGDGGAGKTSLSKL